MRTTAVQIARIAAFTVIACTSILGLCIIASSWIEATASCSQLIHAEALLHQQIQNDDTADRPSYQALVDPLQSDESSESKQESIATPIHHKEQNTISQNSINSQPQFDSQNTPIQIKLPLQLDFDEIAGSLMEKNQRSRMNCVVEKKRAEEVMDHQPKTVRLPFGVNITTDPRYEHVTGERMAIYCETGNDQRHLPIESMQQQQQQQAPFIVPMSMPMNIPMMMPNPQPLQHHPQVPGPINHIPLSMITRATQEENAPPQQQKEESPITIIAREEHVIPIFQQMVHEMRPITSNSIEGRRIPEKLLYHPAGPEARMMSEGRMLHTLAIPENRQSPVPDSRSMPHSGNLIPAVPSEIVRPPPPPAFHKIPIHVPTILQQVGNQHDNTLADEAESDPRPHYVQPRSVRSVESVLHPREKRVRRYACECTC